MEINQAINILVPKLTACVDPVQYSLEETEAARVVYVPDIKL
jgi:hypothetical protein